MEYLLLCKGLNGILQIDGWTSGLDSIIKKTIFTILHRYPLIMVQRWLCISTRANGEVTRKKLVWGVASRYQNTIARVKKGDTLLMYTMQEIVDREVIPSAVAGIYEVISDVYEDEAPIFITPQALGNEIFPLRIKVKPVNILKEPIPFKPLIPKMTFIKNKTMWSGSIRTAMRVIPEEDYKLIVSSR